MFLHQQIMLGIIKKQPNKGGHMQKPTLADALATLKGLSADELTDLIDYAEYYPLDIDAVLSRRKGKPTFPSKFNPYPKNQWQPTPAAAITAAIIDQLSKEDVETFVSTARVLRDALAPVIRKHVDDQTGEAVEAQGTIQAKEIPKPRYNPFTGEYIRTDYYYYLYLRQWATGGGKNRDQKRLKNKYLGCPRLAHQLYHTTDPDEYRRLYDMIFEAYHAGSLNALEGRAPINFDNVQEGDPAPDEGD
jgi:hypothetical protein